MDDIIKSNENDGVEKDESPSEKSLDNESDNENKTTNDNTSNDNPQVSLFEVSEKTQITIGGIILVTLVVLFVYRQNITFPEINIFPETSAQVSKDASNLAQDEAVQDSSTAATEHKDGSLYYYDFAGVEFSSPYQFELTHVKTDVEENKTYAHYKAKDSSVYLSISDFHEPNKYELKRVASADEDNLINAFLDTKCYSSIDVAERTGSINYLSGPTYAPVGKYYSYSIIDTDKKTKVEVHIHSLSKDSVGDKIYYGLLSSITYDWVHLK